MAGLDKDRLIQLLRGIQEPDTEKVKALSQELQSTYYSQPLSLLLLIDVSLTSHDDALRKLASVQALRLVSKHWLQIDPSQQQLVRQHLLEGAVCESVVSVRHSLSRLLAMIAHLDLENEKGGDLLRCVLALCTASSVTSREVGSSVIFELMENDSTHFSDDLTGLLAMLSRNIVDPESNEVRINTAKSIWSILMLVEPEDEASVTAVQALVSPIVNVLKSCLSANDEPSYTALFEVLSLFLSYDPVFLAPHFQDLLQFMVEIACTKELPDDARSLAIDLLTQCTRFRRMKIQAMKDMGALLIKHAMAIMAEPPNAASTSPVQVNGAGGHTNNKDEDDDDIDEDDDKSPRRAAMVLIDHLANSLPPRQVIVPLLEEFTRYSSDPNPLLRRTGILALGVAAEGAPDFISTQIDEHMSQIVRLLCDPVSDVRNAALDGLINIADEMADSLSNHHEDIITAVLQNLEAASQTPSDRRSARIIRSACGALDSLGNGIEGQEIAKYGPRLIVPIGKLLSHNDLSIRSSAAGAIGSIALSMGAEFEPYYHDVLTALAPFVTINDSPEALTLRSSVCDAMGRIASAVGPEAFQPYVMDLMRASEEALSIEDEHLKETSFLLWAALARVYGEQFQPFLAGVFAGLLESLKLEEEIVSLPSNAVMDEGTSEKLKSLIIGGKKITIQDSIDDMADADSDSNCSHDFEPVTGAALEQEVAIETLGDVITHACGREALEQYVKPCLDRLMPLAEHSYEGCRKNAIVTIWRIYARVWQVWEKQNGVKWTPGLPPNPIPDSAIVEIGTLLEKVTMGDWVDEAESSVICGINSHVASTLKACGPAILAVKDSMLQDMMDIVFKILTRAHACQLDLGDDTDEQEAEHGSSELDWLVIDTALEVVTGLAAALGPQFIERELWRKFERPLLKLISSSVNLERSTAVGVIAEIIKYCGEAVSPFTRQLYAVLDRRMTDADMLTRSNATYGMGELLTNVSDAESDAAGIPAMYSALWDRLEPMLTSEPNHTSHIVDNSAGCVARMIARRPDPAFVSEALPLLARCLPLTGDYEENTPVFACIYKLYDLGNSTVQQLTPVLLSVFERALSPPKEQLEESSRVLVQQMVQRLFKTQPDLFQAHPNLPRLAGMT